MLENKMLNNSAVVQIGLIVHDIERTSQAYAELLGVEKPQWFITDPLEKSNCEYKGKPSEARAKLAFLDMGQVQLELIEPDEHPSTWREHLDLYGEGVHHIAFMVEGMDERITLFEKKGMPLVQKGDYTGGRYAYLDTAADLKVVLELLEKVKS